MLKIRKAPFSSAIVAALVAFGCANVASAQRPYQEYWEQRMEEQEPVEVIEDDAPVRDLDSEQFLVPAGQTVGETYFPGDPAVTIPPMEAAALENYASGALALESGNPYKALEGFREAAKRSPKSAYLRLRAAEIAVSLNDLEIAEELVDEVLALDSGNSRALIARGDIAIRRQRYPEAAEWYERALAEKPGNIQALLMLTRLAYDVERDFESTRDLSQRILHEDDRNLQALLWYAEASSYLDDIEGAATHYGRLLYYRPDLVDRMVEMARRLSSLGKKEMATRLFEESLMTDPGNPSYLAQWQQLLAESGEETVREGYERILETSNNDPEVANLFAKYLSNAGNRDRLRELRLTVLEGYPQHIPSLMDLAKISLEQNDFPTAREYFEKVLSARPNDSATYRDIGAEYLKHGDYVDAREVLETALLLDPEDVDSLNMLAGIEEWEDNPKIAELLLNRAIEATSDKNPMIMRLARLYFRTGDYAKAEQTFRRVLVTEPRDSGAWTSIALTRVQAGDETMVGDIEDEVIETLGDDSAVLVYLASVAAEAGMVERARRILVDYLLAQPESLAARAELARIYAHTHEEAKAIAVMQSANQHARDTQTQLQLKVRFAELYETLGQFKKASDTWGEIADAIPSQLVYRERQIVATLRAGQRDAAEKALADLVSEFGRDRPNEVQKIRATYYMRQGDPARAVRVLSDLVKENPDDMDAVFQLANAGGEANNMEVAEANYRRILSMGESALNTYYAVAANNLAYLFSERNIRLDEAEELATIALKKEPNSPIYMDTLAWINYQRGDLELARKQLEKAARSVATDPEIYSHLGQVYEELGESALAYTYYEKALKADPTLDDVREKRDALAITSSRGKVPTQADQ